MSESLQLIDQGEDVPALDLAPIGIIHRDPNGFIAFVRKTDPQNPPLDRDGKPKKWENMFSIRVSDLPTLPGLFDAWLTHDSYMSVNSFYRAARYLNARTGLPDALRTTETASRLNTCYADIDGGRPESADPLQHIGWRQALLEAGVLADRGIIPQPSIMARSGQGVYLFWLLRDEKNPALPPKAWPEDIPIYKACNRALQARILENRLPADTGAFDVARVLRLPGSIHRKVGRRVEYIIQADRSGGFFYTLPEMAAFCGVLTPALSLPKSTRSLAIPPGPRKAQNPGSSPLRSAGPAKLNARRAQDLVTIARWRGGFLKRGELYPDGTRAHGRRRILVMYAYFLRGSKTPRSDALQALQTMAAKCRPPYPSDPDDTSVSSIIKSVYEDGKFKKYKTEYLCSNLGITETAARDLELLAIRPRSVALEADRARPMQKDVIERRRDFARHLIIEQGRRLSCREYMRAVEAAGFEKISHETANRDLNEIGYRVSERPAGGRRPRKEYNGGK